MPARPKSAEKAFGGRIMREEKLPWREREKLRHRRRMLAAALDLTNAFLFLPAGRPGATSIRGECTVDYGIVS